MLPTIGPAVGKAFIPGEGTCTVFSCPEKPNSFTVQADRSGRRYWFARSAVPWRKSNH